MTETLSKVDDFGTEKKEEKENGVENGNGEKEEKFDELQLRSR